MQNNLAKGKTAREQAAKAHIVTQKPGSVGCARRAKTE